MGGVRLAGRAVNLADSPPFSMYEGLVAPADADQGNVWRQYAATYSRMTPFSDPTCTPVCSDEPHTPRISPNRQYIAYCDFDPEGSGSQQLRICAADGSQGSIADYPDTILYDNIGEPEFGLWINHPCWHPDGDKIVFTDAAPDNGYGLGGVIKEVTFPGGVDTTLWTPQQQTAPPQRENGLHPWYSPDGTKIAFLVSQDGGTTCGTNNLDCSRQGLWVMDADGSNDMQIADWNPGLDWDAGCMYDGTQIAWSNDSEWIAYVAQGAGADLDGGIYKIRPDGTDETLLLTGGTDNRFNFIGWGAWLDGDAVMICSSIDTDTEAGMSILRLDTDGSETFTKIFDGTAFGSLGPMNSQNFHSCWRDQTRVWWFPGVFLDNEIGSCLLDGSDLTYVAFDDCFIGSGVGIEWV